MDMRDHIREKSDLAHTYAEDGAYHSAARTLTQLATDVAEHALKIDAELGIQHDTATCYIELVARRS